MDEDTELLRRYVASGSEDAFGALVARHADLVWSSALRQVGGDPHKAEDVAQVVFTTLALKARRLKPGVVLPGWLLNATRYAAADLRKSERRRRVHERKAAMTPIETKDSAAGPASDGRTDGEETWSRVAPVLDEALARLSDPLRTAVVLRYFDGRSMRDVAARLGVSEQAARQRVCRGLERLRAALARKSVAVPAAALASLLSAHAVRAAPAGVASTLAAGASLAAAAGANGLAGPGGALWLLGGWTRGAAAAGVFVALLGSVAVLIVLEMAGQPGEETVILARPASPAAGVPGTPNVPPHRGTAYFARPAPGAGSSTPGDLVLRTPVRAVRSATTAGGGGGPSIQFVVEPTARPTDQDQAPARPEGGN
jgi:RNA polymerase sigma factor (sigma-70 family)